eukprot:scaffold9268_cov125-Isochrysis_galbana.AAC.2
MVSLAAVTIICIPTALEDIQRRGRGRVDSQGTDSRRISRHDAAAPARHWAGQRIILREALDPSPPGAARPRKPIPAFAGSRICEAGSAIIDPPGRAGGSASAPAAGTTGAAAAAAATVASVTSCRASSCRVPECGPRRCGRANAAPADAIRGAVEGTASVWWGIVPEADHRGRLLNLFPRALVLARAKSTQRDAG